MRKKQCVYTEWINMENVLNEWTCVCTIFTNYEKALEDDSENPTALNGLGYVLACEGEDLTKALSCCKKALDILPESAACLDSLGWVYYKMGLYSESKKFLNRAMKADSSNPIIVEHLQEVKKAEE